MPASTLSSVLLPLPFGPTMPKNSPSPTENVTSRSASFRSYAMRLKGCAKYSFSRARCSCGIQNVFETPTASIELMRAPLSCALREARCGATVHEQPEREQPGRDRDRDEPGVDPGRDAAGGGIRSKEHGAHILQDLDERV